MQVRRFITASALALAGALASPAAFAQSCAGFTDVSNASTFCPNVEWLKNRAITLGCSSTTLYCPNDPVTRLAMAAFMNRLGTALTPVFLSKRQTAAQLGAMNFSAAQTVCITDPVAPSATGFTVTGFPRTAVLTGLLNLFTPDAGFEVEARLVYSTNNGASWLPMPAGDGFAFASLHAGFSPPFDTSLRPYAFMDLDVGTTYRFALQGVRTNGTGAIANAYCELHAQIVNRNGTSSPLDPALDGLPPGRGK